MSFTMPYVFVPGTKAVAEHVNDNFTACRNGIGENTNNITTINNTLSNDVIKKDGSNNFEQIQKYSETVMTTLSIDIPSALTHKKYVDDAIENKDTTKPALYTPYAVNSGKKDTNGTPNFITKVDNGSVRILAGGSNPSVVFTYPDGTVEAIEENVVVDDIVDDGTHVIIKEKGQDPTWVKLRDDQSVIPPMTSNSCNGFTAEAINWYDTNYYPYEAFDGVRNSASNCWLSQNGTTSGWLRAQLATARKITEYSLKGRFGSLNTTPKSWTFEASHDDTNWIVLDTQTNHTDVDNIKTCRFENDTSYIYYRINITEINGGTYIGIEQLDLFESYYKMTETDETPESPMQNDYWLDTSVKPHKPYKFNGTVWEECQFVKLGEVKRTNGILANPVNYAFNHKTSFETGALALATCYDFDVNIPLKNLKLNSYLECIKNDLGYEEGNKIYNWGSESNVLLSAKNKLTFVTGSAKITNLANKTSGTTTAITPSNWRFGCEARGMY